MKTQNVQRMYEARLVVDDARFNLLSENLRLYQAGADYFLRWLLNVGACVTPHDVFPESNFKIQVDAPTKGKRNKTDEIKTVVCEWTPALYCLTSWFSLESSELADHPSTEGYKVSPSAIPNLFAERWRHAGGNPADLESDQAFQTIINSLPEMPMRRDSVWIDRQACAVTSLHETGLCTAEANKIVHFFKFPFLPCTGGAAPQFAISLLSNLWGDDTKKSDWGAALNFWQTFADVLRNGGAAPGLTRKEIAKMVLDRTQVTDHPSTLQSSLKISGNPGLLNWFKQSYSAPFDSETLLSDEEAKATKQPHKSRTALLSKVEEKIQACADTGGFQSTLGKEWRVNLREDMERTLGVKYQVGKSRRIKQFVEMVASAASRFASCRSNTRNQVEEKIQRFYDFQRLQRIAEESPEEIRETVSAYKDEKQQKYLQRYQVACFGDVVKIGKKENLSPVAALARAQEIHNGDLGDTNLICKLANNLDDEIFYEAGKYLQAIAKADTAREKFELLRLHLMTLPNQNPFFGGDSHPSGEITIKELNNLRIEMGLFNFPTPNDIVSHSFPAKGRRFAQEFRSHPDAEQNAPRNDRLFRIQLTGDRDIDVSPSVNPTSFAFQPFIREETNAAYVRIAATLPIPRLTTKEIVEKKDLRILAVELGITDVATYSVLTRNDAHPHILLESLNPHVKGNIGIEIGDHGIIQEDHFYKYYGEGKRHEGEAWRWKRRSRFAREDNDRTLTDREFHFLQQITREMNGHIETYNKEAADGRSRRRKFTDTPESACMFYSLLSNMAYVAVRMLGTDARETVKKIYEFSFPPQPNNFIPDSRDRGGLSYHRLNALETLTRACQSLIRRFENSAIEPPQWVVSAMEHLTSRRTARRRERVRLTVNHIVRLALENQCDCVVVGNLSLSTSRMAPKFINRQLSAWMPLRMLEQLSDCCALHGLFLRTVNPAYMSRSDSSRPNVPESERLYCRFSDKMADHVVKKTLLSLWNREPNNAQDQIAAVQAEMLAYARHHKLAQDPETIAKHYVERSQSPVPAIGGNLYLLQNPCFAQHISEDYLVRHHDRVYLHAEVNAALNIGYRGLRSFFDWENKKQPSQEEEQE